MCIINIRAFWIKHITVILAVSLSTAAKAQYQLPPTVERHQYSYTPGEDSYQPQYDPYPAQERRETFGNGARSSSTFNFGQRKIAVQVQHQAPDAYVDVGGRQNYRAGSSPARRLADGFSQNYQLHNTIPAQNNVFSPEIRQPEYNSLPNEAYGGRQDVAANPYSITNPINGQKFPVEQPVWRQNGYDVNVDYRGQITPTFTTAAPPVHNFQFHNNFLPQNSFLNQFGRQNAPAHTGFIISNGAVYRDPSINFQNPFNSNPNFNVPSPQQYQNYEFQDSSRSVYDAGNIYSRPSSSNEIKIDQRLSDKVITQVAPPTSGIVPFESAKFTNDRQTVTNSTLIRPIEETFLPKTETTTAPSTMAEPTSTSDSSNVGDDKLRTVLSPTLQQPTSSDSTRNQYYNNLVKVPDYSNIYQQTDPTRQPTQTVAHNFNLYFQPTPGFDSSSSVASVDQRLQQPVDFYVPTTSKPQQQSEFVFYQSTPPTPSNNFQGLLPGQVNDGLYSNSDLTQFNPLEDKNQQKETLFSVNGFEEEEPLTTTVTVSPSVSTSAEQTSTIGHHETKTEISEITVTELPQTTTTPVSQFQKSFLSRTSNDRTTSRNEFVSSSILINRGRERFLPTEENSNSRNTNSDRTTNRNDVTLQSDINSRGRERFLPTEPNSFTRKPNSDLTQSRYDFTPPSDPNNRGRERLSPANFNYFSRKTSTDQTEVKSDNIVPLNIINRSRDRSRVSPVVDATPAIVDDQYSQVTTSNQFESDGSKSHDAQTESVLGQTFGFSFEANSPTSTPSGTTQTEENAITETTQGVEIRTAEAEPSVHQSPSYGRDAAVRRKKIRVQNKPTIETPHQEQQSSIDERVNRNRGEFRGRKIKPNYQNWAVPEIKQRVLTRGRYHATIPQRNSVLHHRTTTHVATEETTVGPPLDPNNDEETSTRHHSPSFPHRGQTRFYQPEPTTSTNQDESPRTSTVSQTHLPHLRYQIRQKVRPTEPQKFEETTTQAAYDSETTEQTHFISRTQSNTREESTEEEQDHQTEISEQTPQPEKVFTVPRYRPRGQSYQKNHDETVRKEERPVFSLKKHSFNGRLRVSNPVPVEDKENPQEERKQVRYNSQFPQRQMIIKRIKVKTYNRQEPSENQDQDASGSIRTGYRRNQESPSKNATSSYIRNSVRFPPRKPFNRFSTTQATINLQTKAMTSETRDAITTDTSAQETINTTTDSILVHHEVTTSRVTEKRQILDDTDLEDLLEDSQTLENENKSTNKKDKLINLKEESTNKENYPPNDVPLKPAYIEMDEYEDADDLLPEDNESGAISPDVVEFPLESAVVPSILPEIAPSQNPADIVTRIDVVTSISEDIGQSRMYEGTAII